MKEELSNIKKAVLQFCILVLKEDTKNQIESKDISKDKKLSAIKKLKDYFIEHQDYENAAWSRDIEKQLEQLEQL